MIDIDIESLYKILCILETSNLLINYDSELSINDYKALRTIQSYSPHCPIQAIGKSLNITKSGATRFINRLEKSGLIKKYLSPNDGRVCCIVLTEKGNATHQKASNHCKNEIQKKLTNLNKEDTSQINNSLKYILLSINNNRNED